MPGWLLGKAGGAERRRSVGLRRQVEVEPRQGQPSCDEEHAACGVRASLNRARRRVPGVALAGSL